VNRFLSLSALLSTAAILSVPTIAGAVPLESIYSAATKDSNPVYYMEQPSGSMLDLTGLCTSMGRPIDSSSASNRSSFSRSERDTSGKSIFPGVTESNSSSNDLSEESASTSIGTARLNANEKIFGNTRFGASNYDEAANCSTPDDTMANGRRCGARAASVRVGGE
jgi:hypothetical protein